MLSYPQQINSNILKFENRNDLIINIFTCENKTIVPVRLSSKIDKIYLDFLNGVKDQSINEDNIREYVNDLIELNHHKRLVNLFLYSNHYSLITKLSRLISKQIDGNMHTSSKDDNNIYNDCICYRCLNHTYSPLKYFNHLRFCISEKGSKAVIDLPKPGTMIEFNKHQFQQKLPFAVYYDFECYFNEFVHVPVAASYYISSTVEEDRKQHNIMAKEEGDNVALKFCKSLIYNLIVGKNSVYNKYFKKNKRFEILKVSEEEKKAQTSCSVCGVKFEIDSLKVVDHDHFTGKFRGMAHKECNLNFKEPTFIPIIGHNASKYDIHLFIKEMSELSEVDDNMFVTYLPTNKETFISFSVKYKVGAFKSKKDGKMIDKYIELRFLDSLRFMNNSLDALVSNLS